MKQLIDRTGEVSQTKRGETIKIVNYNDSNDIDVEFLEYIYGASCRVGNNKPIWLGRSHDPMECFRRYKICKENYIKQVADEYKEYLPTYIYDILYSYKIEIND